MSLPVTHPSLRDRVGGRWAVSWVTFVVLGTLGVLSVSLNDLSAGDWLVANASATAAFGLVLLAAHLTVLRTRAMRPVAVWVVAAVGAAAGLARAAVLVATVDAVGGTLVRPWLVFVLAGVLTGVLGTVGIALAMDMLSRNRDQREALRTRLVALREQDIERSGLADAMTDAVYAEVASALDDARRHLEVPVGEADAAERLAVAENLRGSVDRTLRPLSHRLYAAGQEDADGHRAPRLRVASLASLPVLPLPTSLVITLFVVGGSEFPLAGLFTGVVSFLVLLAVSRAGRRWPPVRSQQLVVGALVLFAAGALSVLLVRSVADAPRGWMVILVPALLMVTFMLLVSAVGAVFGETSERIHRLEEQVVAREVDALVANREIARASRDVAQHVHGTLQSHLLATAFAIERAADSGDDAAFQRAIADARVALEDGAVRRVAPRDLADELDHVASLWRGFVDVTVEIDPALPHLPSATVADIARIAGEAVANARKHGLARHARIVVSPGTSGVVVTVTDDGAGLQGGVPGMGSAWLDFIAPGGWTLRDALDGEGAQLEVLLPVAERAAVPGGALS
jgi:signal transduction histidine kinase